MKKILIIVNSVLGLGSLYCLINYLWSFFINLDAPYKYSIDKIFHSTNELLLLIIMFSFQILVNIFVYIIFIYKKIWG